MSFFGTKLDTISRLFFNAPYKKLSAANKKKVKIQAFKSFSNGKGITKKKKSRRGNFMARKRRFSARRARGGIGGGKLMSGLIKPTGLIGAAILGAGAATLAEKVGITNAIPYGNYVAGFAVGGIGGAAGVFARDMLKGGTASSGSAVFL